MNRKDCGEFLPTMPVAYLCSGSLRGKEVLVGDRIDMGISADVAEATPRVENN